MGRILRYPIKTREKQPENRGFPVALLSGTGRNGDIVKKEGGPIPGSSLSDAGVNPAWK